MIARGTAERFAGALEALERGAGCVADVEAAAGATPAAGAVPKQIALHLAGGIESPLLYQALRQTESHGGVVGPLARLEAKRTAAHDVLDRRERARRLELECRAEGVAGGEAQQAAPEAAAVERVERCRHHPLLAFFVQVSIQSRKVWYQSTLFCGFSIQWPSSGNSRSLEGTFWS